MSLTLCHWQDTCGWIFLHGSKARRVAKDNWQTTAWQLSQAQQPQKIPAHDEHG